MNQPYAHKNTGFTIIELTIALIIIGILVSILAIAYAGTQKSARSTQYKSDATTIAQLAKLAAGYNDGQFPLTAADFTGPASIQSESNLSIGTIKTSSDAAPTSTSQISTPPAYTMQVCTNSRTGVVVFYPDPASGETAIGSVQTGKWSAGC